MDIQVHNGIQVKMDALMIKMQQVNLYVFGIWDIQFISHLKVGPLISLFASMLSI